jgi:hypothetical protein
VVVVDPVEPLEPVIPVVPVEPDVAPPVIPDVPDAPLVPVVAPDDETLVTRCLPDVSVIHITVTASPSLSVDSTRALSSSMSECF